MVPTSTFFNSWPGMFIAQSFLHSLIAAIIVDTALIAWHIDDPRLRQRFRLIVIVLPIAAFPLFQLMNPDRSSALFRLDALLDSSRWLNLEIWGTVPVGVLFLLLLGFTAVLFVSQELLPIIRHARTSPRDVEAVGTGAHAAEVVAQARNGLPGSLPEVIVIDDDDLLMFSTTGPAPAIYLSRGFVETLSADELQAAIAHEVGHVLRSRRPFMVLVFVLRVMMFYNPVILMEFRRIAQEEEKICDDLAVGMTGGRSALAGALRKFSPSGEGPGSAGGDAGMRDRLEEYGHSLLLENRIVRLEGPVHTGPRGGAVFAVVLATLLAVSYYLV